MVRALGVVLAAWIGLAAPGPARSQEPGDEGEKDAAAPAVETWYAQGMGRGESGAVVSHYWSKGNHFRADVVVGGHRIITIVNGEYYYTLDELSGTGVGIRRAPAAIREDLTRVRPFGTELVDLLAEGGEKIRSSEVAGSRCDLYRLTDEVGRRTVCADPKRGLPLQVERYDRSTGKTEVLNYLAWIGGMEIPDQFFEPDPRFEVERFALEEYASRSRRQLVGPAPPLYRTLLYGNRSRR
ncbi:MAG: hypothetical protein ACQGVK_21745 [Myxococcota bacterium]